MGRRSAGAALEMSVRTTGAGTDECDGAVSSFARRTKSAGRLLGIAPPPGRLNDVIEIMLEEVKLEHRRAELHVKKAEKMDANVRHSNNTAIADVGQHHAEMYRMLANKLKILAREKRHYIEELRKTNEADKSIREAEMRVTSLYEKKAKIVESLRKGSVGFLRRRSEDDTLRKRQQLEQVTMEIEAAVLRLEDTRKEAEIIKMFRYRTAMQGIADSSMAYASAMSNIFSCFREVTEYVPAISTQDVMTMNYDGASITQNLVARLRRDIASSTVVSPQSQLLGAASRRHSGNHRHGGGRGGGYPAAPALTPPSAHGGGPSTPPPPYTPTAPTMSELPQPGGGASTLPETSSTPTARASPPRFANLSLYPKLPANPYRRSGGLHS